MEDKVKNPELLSIELLKGLLSLDHFSVEVSPGDGVQTHYKYSQVSVPNFDRIQQIRLRLFKLVDGVPF